MMNITPSRNADAARDYFARSLSPGDYYAENGGVPSVWLGKGAERLGLHGEEVTGEVFGWLVHNHHPFTGDRLTQRNRANRLPGYDFTFHAPKSVSVAESMGDASIRSAFRDAVRETMGEIELEMQTRVRKGGVHENRTTGNMLWAEFVHDTTRPVDGVPDPQLHCHCYAINATFDETEKCWKAGKFRALKRDAPYYQARFLNTLAFKMQALGYETVRTKSGFELVGVPETAIKSFSRRSRLIDELADKYGIDDPRAKARIGQWSRESKGTRHTRDDLVGLWHDRMTDQEREAVFETLQRAAMRRDGSLMPVVPYEDPFSPGAVAPSAALRHAIEHCYERRSVVSDKQLAARAIAFGIGRVPSDTIDTMIAAGETPEGGRVFLSRKVDDQKLVTTHAVLEEERRMLDLAASTRGTCFGLGMKIARGSADNGWMYSIDDGGLSPEQYEVCRHVLSSRDRVIAIAGAAGVGKTRLMREVARGVAYGGAQVFAFAPNAETVEDALKKSGFDDARTVTYLLTNKRLQEQLRGQAIWIDEAGQLGAKTMRELIELAVEKNARLILTGDTRQHTAVERGDAMRLLSERAGIVPAELQVIRRQKGLYREAIEKLAGGEATKGFDLLDEMEAIMELDGEAFDRFERLAKDYADTIGRGMSALVVSPTHAEGERATRAIRAELKERGVVGGVGWLKGEDRAVERLVATEWTQAERADPVNYAPGLVVQFHQNVGSTKEKDGGGFTRGDRVEVSRVERGIPDEQGGARVWCIDGKGKERALPLDHAGRFDVYAKEELRIAAGEKLRVTKNARLTSMSGDARRDREVGGQKLVNGQMLTVAGFTPGGDIKLDNGMVIPKDFGHLAHGYCTTSHAAQGKTVDAVFIAQGVQSLAASSMEQFYVSASRAREEIRIYTDDKHELREAIVQSEQRLSASELVEGPDGGGEGGGGTGGQTPAQRPPEKSPDKEAHRNPVRDRAMHNARLAKHAMLRNAAPQNERVRERSLPMKQIDPKFLASAYQKRALKGREMEM